MARKGFRVEAVRKKGINFYFIAQSGVYEKLIGLPKGLCYKGLEGSGLRFCKGFRKAPSQARTYSSAWLLELPKGFLRPFLAYGVASKVQGVRNGSRLVAAMELETLPPWGNTSTNHPTSSFQQLGSRAVDVVPEGASG